MRTHTSVRKPTVQHDYEPDYDLDRGDKFAVHENVRYTRGRARERDKLHVRESFEQDRRKVSCHDAQQPVGDTPHQLRMRLPEDETFRGLASVNPIHNVRF